MKVVKVYDGDTFTAEVSGKIEKIRLAEIDAPELKQPYGQEAKEFLSGVLDSGKVCLLIRDEDLYRRLLADVRVGTFSVNHSMIRYGWAWVYTQYSTDVKLLLDEERARSLKRGLWQDLNPVKPWIWRRKQH